MSELPGCLAQVPVSHVVCPVSPPPPLCLLCSPGDKVCAHVPMLLFPREAGVCVTRLPHVLPTYNLTPAIPAAVIVVSVVLENKRVETLAFAMLTFDSRTSKLADWHGT